MANSYFLFSLSVKYIYRLKKCKAGIFWYHAITARVQVTVGSRLGVNVDYSRNGNRHDRISRSTSLASQIPLPLVSG